MSTVQQLGGVITLTLNTKDMKNIFIGDNTTSSTSMSIAMSIQEYDTSSKGWDIPYNITGNKA